MGNDRDAPPKTDFGGGNPRKHAGERLGADFFARNRYCV